MYQDRAVEGPVLWVAVWAPGPACLQSLGVAMRVLAARDHGCTGVVLVSYPRADRREVGGK
jgi:hypothetical protein